jgi:hypothetical protein
LFLNGEQLRVSRLDDRSIKSCVFKGFADGVFGEVRQDLLVVGSGMGWF